jgi:hypothetical protein
MDRLAESGYASRRNYSDRLVRGRQAKRRDRLEESRYASRRKDSDRLVGGRQTAKRRDRILAYWLKADRIIGCQGLFLVKYFFPKRETYF